MRNTNQPLRAGELEHRITITGPPKTRSVAELEVEADVPAAIGAMPPDIGERVEMGGINASNYYLVSVRYRTDLRTSDVLTELCCTQRVFQVLSLVPSDRKDAIDMMCVAQG